MPHPCNDHIIRGGQFVRDFEAMYQEHRDPWAQSERATTCPLNQMALGYLELLYQTHPQPESILDIGSGPGHLASRLKALGAPNARYHGIDVSPTAVEQASQCCANLGPGISFEVLDIAIHQPALVGRWDLMFAAKTLYYVAPEIDAVLEHLALYLAPGGRLCWTYNWTPTAFTNRWLTYESLRNKFRERNWCEEIFVEINRLCDETFVFGVYRHG